MGKNSLICSGPYLKNKPTRFPRSGAEQAISCCATYGAIVVSYSRISGVTGGFVNR
jgi:hypothetical protein